MNLLGDGITSRLGYKQTIKETSSSRNENTTSSSNITANNIVITTKKNDFLQARGDINIIGSNLNGGNIALTGKEVNIKAQENTTTSNSSSDTKSFNLGVNAGVNLIDFNTISGYGGINGGAGSESLSSITHTASNILGTNISINAKNDTNIIGSSINASGDTTIKANNVYLGSTTDTHLNYQFEYGLDASGDVGVSLTRKGSANLNAGAKADATFNAGSTINNASINTDSLTIATHKNLNHPLKSLIKGNGSLALNGGNINVKNDANIALKDNLIISSQHDTSVRGDANLETNIALRGNILSGLLAGGGEINAKGEATLNSMSGISAGSVNITTLSSNFDRAIDTGVGAVTGLATGVVLGVAGKEVGQIIAHIASDKIGEAMQGTYSQEKIKKTQDFVESLGKPLGDMLQKNHKEIANVVFETFKGGNTSITNGYIQSTDPSKTSSISTDKLVYHDIGNIKFDTTQKINVGGIVTPLFLGEIAVRTAVDWLRGDDVTWTSLGLDALKTFRPSITIGGSPINIETSKNHSSISSSIQITSTNQSDITRGDRQKEPSGFKKDKIKTQSISVNPSKIIEKVM